MPELTLTPGSPDWKLWRKRGLQDLYFFNAKILGHEEIVPMTYRAHYALMRFAERKTGIPAIDQSRVQLIQIWRGAGKSVGVTKGRSLQRLCQNRNYAIGIANEKQDNANAFLGMIKSEIESNPLLRSLYPEIVPPDFRKTEWRADRIVINRTRPNPVNPSVLATGAGATVVGVHMNEWIVDDIISQDAAENARAGSYSEIEKANRWVVRLQPLLVRPKEDPITFIGTPWWVEDTYQFVEQFFGRGEEPTRYLWTLELPDGEMQEIELEQMGELAIFRHYPIDSAGRAVWPEGGLTLEALEQLQQDDPVFASAQYFLRPSAGRGIGFREDWLKYYGWDTKDRLHYRDSEGTLHYERVADLACTISCDPAISKRRDANRTAVIVTGTNGNQIFMLEAYAGHIGVHETAQRILAFYRQYRPQRIVVETVAYQQALMQVLHRLAIEQNLGPLPVTEHKAQQSKKHVRIMGLEPYFSRGLLYCHPAHQDFLEEYRNYQGQESRRVDMLDALAFQMDVWERLISRDGSGREAWKDRARLQAQRVRRALGGRKSRGLSSTYPHY